MRCSRCGVCCNKTEMLLSEADIERLERAGYYRQEFARYDRHGFARLRNRRGFCVFYDITECSCRIYKHRPLGCRIYPVIYSEKEGMVVDYLCPMSNTVSQIELKRKGRRLAELLQRVDNEASHRNAHTSSSTQPTKANKPPTKQTPVGGGPQVEG